MRSAPMTLTLIGAGLVDRGFRGSGLFLLGLGVGLALPMIWQDVKQKDERAKSNARNAKPPD